jgi:hypothetical protein
VAHQHAQLADEVACFDHEDDAVVPAVEEKDAAREDEVQVIRVTGVPQQLAGLRVQDLTGRLQHVQCLLAEHRPGQGLNTVVSVRRVDGPLVLRWDAAHSSSLRSFPHGHARGALATGTSATRPAPWR